VKKTLLWLACAVITLSVAAPAFADGNPWVPPNKGTLSTVLNDGNPWVPPNK
jgi:hypothetical protein